MNTVGQISEREERPPYVVFERRAVEDTVKSRESGRYVAKDVDFVLITPPYSKDRVEMIVDKWFENKKREVAKGRTPKKWLDDWMGAYKAFQNGEEIPLNGTPIKTWQAISPAEIATVIAAGIRTVEDLAACNDEGLRRIGMGGRNLVGKANSWLKGANDTGKIALENAALSKQVEEMKTTISSLEEKINLLKNMVETKEESSDTVVNIQPRQAINISDILHDEKTEEVRDEPVQALPLADQYYAKFGKMPHWKMKEETIRAKLEE